MSLAPESASTSQTEELELDDALDDTFPASDPPSMTDPTHGVRIDRTAADEGAIRQRAYEIWQSTGAPDGHHEAHWAQARRELEAEAEGTPVSDEPALTPLSAEQVR